MATVGGVNVSNASSTYSLNLEDANSKQKDDVIQKFGKYLENAVNSVNDLQLESKQTAEDFAVGKTDNIHQVMLVGKKAEVAFQLMAQIRGKIMEAYNEIMKLPM